MTIHIHRLLIANFSPSQNKSVLLLNFGPFCKHQVKFPDLYYDNSSFKTPLLQVTFLFGAKSLALS